MLDRSNRAARGIEFATRFSMRCCGVCVRFVVCRQVNNPTFWCFVWPCCESSVARRRHQCESEMFPGRHQRLLHV